MIIAKGHDTSNNQPLLIIGLSKINLERLQNGQPASNAQTGQTILIIYGETELHIQNDLSELGLLPPPAGN